MQAKNASATDHSSDPALILNASAMLTEPSSEWAPFRVVDASEKPQMPRPLKGPFGIGDRLRWVAFAELQASRGFAWAAERYSDAPEELKNAWRLLAQEELKHMNWILDRMAELNVAPEDRKLRADLWTSFMKCETARDFTQYMASAEERGRSAGVFFAQTLRDLDPKTGLIFEKIAAEEVEHVRLATQFYPDLPPITP